MELLKKINDIVLVSGYEHHFLDSLRELAQEYTGVQPKVIGKNLFFPGESERILVAHYDEIGYIVDAHFYDNLYRAKPRGMIKQGPGMIFESYYKGEKIEAYAASPLPHRPMEGQPLYFEIFYPEELPEQWPFHYKNQLIIKGDIIFSKTLDNHAGVYTLLNLAKKGYSVLLTHGEEEGFTRLQATLDYISQHYSNPQYIVVDAFPSNKDIYAGYSPEEESLGYIAVEGGGTGNVAPQELVELVKRYIPREIATQSKDEITDATTFYRRGVPAISIGYPVKYLHSALESTRISHLKRLEEVLEAIVRA
ncbi:MAG: hypothetical protein GXN92_01410 [Candidatus Micrarchaeota archaeon]|nr:hypothetical protein [Candidatus Micrarchaeota archaeon]